MSSGSSIFQNFPAPPGLGKVTVFEQIGELIAVPQSQASLKFQGYPDVSITKDTTRSLTQRENAKSAFLPQNETIFKHIYHSYQDMGISGALEEVVNSASEVPHWMLSIAQKLRVLARWTSSLHGSFFPHFSLSNEDIATKFTAVTHWACSPIKAFAWHPHTIKFAYALQDDSIRVHMSFVELVPVLKHKLQKNVAQLAWQPNSSSVLAVACQSCILIWHIEPTSLAKRPSSSSVQVLQQSGHCPITSLSWSPDGRILMSASPVDTAMIAWEIAMEAGTPLRRYGGGGVSIALWSPDGSKLLAATPSNLFRIWETRRWSCEKWSTSTGCCKTACWDPMGNILLFATENKPIIYSLTFAEALDETVPVIGGSAVAVACIDLSQWDMLTDGSDQTVKVGGLIQHMVWDGLGGRLAVTFQGNSDYVAVFRTRLFPMLEIAPCGLVKGLDGEKPEYIQFQPHYDKGALLTIMWSSGRIGYVPLYYMSSASSQAGASLQDRFQHAGSTHQYRHGLYSQT